MNQKTSQLKTCRDNGCCSDLDTRAEAKMSTYNQQSEFITTAEALARFEASGEPVDAYDKLQQQCQSPETVP